MKAFHNEAYIPSPRDLEYISVRSCRFFYLSLTALNINCCQFFTTFSLYDQEVLLALRAGITPLLWILAGDKRVYCLTAVRLMRAFFHSDSSRKFHNLLRDYNKPDYRLDYDLTNLVQFLVLSRLKIHCNCPRAKARHRVRQLLAITHVTPHQRTVTYERECAGSDGSRSASLIRDRSHFFLISARKRVCWIENARGRFF